jgi:hypothetical protein
MVFREIIKEKRVRESLAERKKVEVEESCGVGAIDSRTECSKIPHILAFLTTKLQIGFRQGEENDVNYNLIKKECMASSRVREIDIF